MGKIIVFCLVMLTCQACFAKGWPTPKFHGGSASGGIGGTMRNSLYGKQTHRATKGTGQKQVLSRTYYGNKVFTNRK